MKSLESGRRLPLTALTLAALGFVCLLVPDTVHARQPSGRPLPVEVVNPDAIPIVDVTPAASAIPISVTEFVNVEDEFDSMFIEVFVVPAGKILKVDFVSVFADVVVRDRPETGLRILNSLRGRSAFEPLEFVRFQLGYMDEFPLTSRGTPNFVLAKEAPIYLGEGPVNCDIQTNFGGVNLDFGIASCSVSGQLIDAVP